MTLTTAFLEMDSPPIGCREETKYKEQLVAVLAEVSLRRTYSAFVATDLLCISEDLGHSHFVANHAYWSGKFQFGACMWGWPAVFSR